MKNAAIKSGNIIIKSENISTKKKLYKSVGWEKDKLKMPLIKNFSYLFLFIFITILIISLIFYLRIIKQTGYLPNKKNKKNINNQISMPIIKELNLTFYENKLKKLQRESINWPLSNKIKLRPLMSPNDTKVFSHFMKPENTYFEFGSGGSTNLASYYKLKKIYSVESDANWHNKLKKILSNDIIYLTIDLKSNYAFGFPGKGTTVENWKKYIQAYKAEYNADIILIDGRFRVACGLDIFSKIKYDTLVLIHDYNDRKEYHILEKYYIKVKSWDALAAFFKNPNVSFIPEDVYKNYTHIMK